MSDNGRWPRKNKVRDDAVRKVFKARKLDNQVKAFIAAIPGIVDKANKAAAEDADENALAIRRSNTLRAIRQAQKHVEKAAHAMATPRGARVLHASCK